jgi:L-threonylcarbamoyladenylate synthase
MNNADLIYAKELLEKGDIIAIPTETVYGLAGNALNEDAIKKIFETKKRPFYNPLIVHISSKEKMDELAEEIPQIAYKLADKFWPGSLTMILKKKPHIPNIVTGGKDTVAIRIPNHPMTLSLLNQLDFPLAAPSANPFGTISPTQAIHVKNYFEDDIKLILDGGTCEKGMESTIIGFENEKVILYRHGAIPIEEIELLAGEMQYNISENNAPIAPGMLSKHYAPTTFTIATTNLLDTIELYPNIKMGIVAFKNYTLNQKEIKLELITNNDNLEEAAKNFYAALHRLDNENLDLIIIERPPFQSIGKTINDRIDRAIKK